MTSGPPPLNSIEGESSGMSVYAHELTHNLGILDNYNNPYNIPPQRAATGNWDMMSRGSFNGPGGPHTRWLIPPTLGSSLGSQHNVRNKLKLGFLEHRHVLQLNRNGLAQSGLATADVTARETDPGDGLARRTDHARRDGRRQLPAMRLQHQSALRRRPPAGQRVDHRQVQPLPARGRPADRRRLVRARATAC